MANTMGDEFFQKVVTDPAGYGLRADLVQNVLAAFFNTMWDKADPLHRKIKFVLLKGDFDPKAFVMVKAPGYCNAQLLAPMISVESRWAFTTVTLRSCSVLRWPESSCSTLLRPRMPLCARPTTWLAPLFRRCLTDTRSLCTLSPSKVWSEQRRARPVMTVCVK